MKRNYILSFLFCVSAIMLLSACQPTPDTELVVNKGDGVYEQKIDSAKKKESSHTKIEPSAESPSADEQPYVFESHWTDTVSLRNFDVNIDVDIEAPVTALFPVYRVKASQFELVDERLQAICNALMGEVVAERLGGATMQDLKEQLEELQKGRYDSETKTWIPYDKTTYEVLSEDILKEMETAPDEKDFVEISDIQVQSFPFTKTFMTEDGTLWEIEYAEKNLHISRNVRGFEQYERWVIDGDALAGEEKGTTLQNVSCTEETARQFVDDFFKTIHIGDMGISSIEKGRIVDIDTSEVLKEGWIVECARKGGVCPAFNYKYYANSSGDLRFQEETYSAGLSAESVLLFVDDKGVASLSWQNPLEIVKTEVSNVEILPFAQIQELIKQAMVNGLSWTGNKKSGSAFSGCYTTRIILSYCFIPVKDAPEEFYFTPAWFVLMKFNNDPLSMRPFMFTLNAVDGTRIDTSSLG